jgi:membrane protease YdiL (CAAX protease family)
MVFSWLRRLRRSMRVCLASIALLAIWSIPEVVALLRPAIAAPLLLLLAMVFVWWYWIRPRPFRRRRGPADLRLRRLPARTLRPLAAGIVAACIASQAVLLLHLRFLPVPSEDPFIALFAIGQQPWGWLLLFLLIVVLAPIIEETVFRGWIQRPLERLWGPAPAVIVSAALFALFHAIPEYLPYYFLMGVLFGGVVLVTRSLWASILLHAAYNLESLVFMYFQPTTLENDVAFAQQTTVVILSAAVLAGAGLFLVGNARRLHATVRPARPLRVEPGSGIEDKPTEVSV